MLALISVVFSPKAADTDAVSAAEARLHCRSGQQSGGGGSSTMLHERSICPRDTIQHHLHQPKSGLTTGQHKSDTNVGYQQHKPDSTAGYHVQHKSDPIIGHPQHKLEVGVGHQQKSDSTTGHHQHHHHNHQQQQQQQHPHKKRFFLTTCLQRQDSNQDGLRIRASFCDVRCQNDNGEHRRVRSYESGRLLCLSDEELRLIRRSWEQLENKQLVCQRLFLKLFSLKASFKQIMHYDDMPPRQVMRCQRFTDHCARFLAFWQSLIDQLSSDRGDAAYEQSLSDEVVGRIRELGYQHCLMPRVTFDAERWLLIKNVLLESLCGQRHDVRQSAYVCWSKLITFVISEMKDAFHDGIRTRCNTL